MAKLFNIDGFNHFQQRLVSKWTRKSPFLTFFFSFKIEMSSFGHILSKIIFFIDNVHTIRNYIFFQNRLLKVHKYYNFIQFQKDVNLVKSGRRVKHETTSLIEMDYLKSIFFCWNGKMVLESSPVYSGKYRLDGSFLIFFLIMIIMMTKMICMVK